MHLSDGLKRRVIIDFLYIDPDSAESKVRIANIPHSSEFEDNINSAYLAALDVQKL
jgi:hypothetical protein